MGIKTGCYVFFSSRSSVSFCALLARNPIPTPTTLCSLQTKQLNHFHSYPRTARSADRRATSEESAKSASTSLFGNNCVELFTFSVFSQTDYGGHRLRPVRPNSSTGTATDVMKMSTPVIFRKQLGQTEKYTIQRSARTEIVTSVTTHIQPGIVELHSE